MKKVIERLEQAKAEIRMSSGKLAEAGLKPHGFISSINEVLAELKTPRWIPYKNLSDAHDCMSEAIKAVEEVTFRGRDEEKRIKTALNRIECAMGAVETLIPLPLPRWETPEQWEKRTGKAWQGAVYFNLLAKRDGHSVYIGDKYQTCSIEEAREIIDNLENKQQCHEYTPVVICANSDSGKPPDGWRPEEDKTP
jgi:hypothetical protein